METQNTERRQIENKFIVPYQQNPHFTGRKRFLQTLKEKLVSHAPKKHNHRIALYGMGGVGKTQCTLEYIYSNKSEYERIYWITAADQSSMLLGFQKIAKTVDLPGLQSATPVEVANRFCSG